MKPFELSWIFKHCVFCGGSTDFAFPQTIPIRSRILKCLLAAATFAVSMSASTVIRAQGSADAEFAIDALVPVTSELEARAHATPPTGATAAQLCDFFQKRGIAKYALGHYSGAIADLNQAYGAATGQVQTDECEQWRIRSDLSAAYRASGNLAAEIEYLERAIAELDSKSVGRLLLLNSKLASSYLQLGRLDDSKRALADAQATLPDLKRMKSWLRRQNDLMATLHEMEARIAMAEGRYREAEALSRQSLDEQQAFLREQRKLHAPDSAQVRAAAEHTAQRERQLASALASTGKLGEAALFARVGLTDTLAQSGANTLEASNALSLLGQIRLRQENVDQASALFDRATKSLQAAQIEPYSRALGRLRAWTGLTFSLQGRWSDAVDVFKLRDIDLRLNPEQFSMIGSGNIDWALALIRTGRSEAAERLLKNMLQARERRGYSTHLSLAYLHGYLGIALVDQGKNDAALAQFAIAMPVLIKPSLDAENPDSDGGFVRQFRLRAIYEAYLDALSRVREDGLTLENIDAANEAFAVADAARNSSVQRAVTSSAARANLPDDRLAKLARDEQDAEHRAQSLDRLLERLSNTASAEEKNRNMVTLERQVAEANTSSAAIRAELIRSFPAYSNLIDPVPTKATDVQRALRLGEVVVSIYVGERRSYVWTITQELVLFRTIVLGREEVVRLVRAIRHSVDLRDGRLKRFDSADALRLYTLLLAPDEHSWATARVLSVVPSGALGQLPLGLLLTEPVSAVPVDTRPNYEQMPWLLRKVAIAQYPSANALVTLRTTTAYVSQRLPFVGFGNPVFVAEVHDAEGQTRSLNQAVTVSPTSLDDEEPIGPLAVRRLAAPVVQSDTDPSTRTNSPDDPGLLSSIYSRLPPLPDTADELNEIAAIAGALPERDVFLGPRATVGNVKRSDLSRYRVVAFATHGVAPGDIVGLDEPALVLSNPVLVNESGSGLLGLDDILALKLNADWVVLSACNTASGDGIGSEAVSGLGRAFMFAGSRSLLVSNWAVETVSARLLTTGVFRQQREHQQLTRAEALRAAAMDVMRSPGGRYRHPAFWAAFSLIGDES
ncbi:CHAT domain-containing protein [Paraburkholderia dipogonis]|uniref:CHAT domain-containing protein n=1 Tax=Paraburkholderia dipogonis TaxID=1211383 RepID=A0ABW9B7H2_9BURK